MPETLQYTVRLLRTVAPRRRRRIARRLAARLGTAEERVLLLLSRPPGFLTKPVSKMAAESIFEAFEDEGVGVEMILLEAKEGFDPYRTSTNLRLTSVVEHRAGGSSESWPDPSTWEGDQRRERSDKTYAVSLIVPVPPQRLETLVRRVASLLNIDRERLARLLARDPGLITKPLTRTTADRIASILIAEGVVVETVRLLDEAEGGPDSPDFSLRLTFDSTAMSGYRMPVSTPPPEAITSRVRPAQPPAESVRDAPAPSTSGSYRPSRSLTGKGEPANDPPSVLAEPEGRKEPPAPALPTDVDEAEQNAPAPSGNEVTPVPAASAETADPVDRRVDATTQGTAGVRSKHPGQQRSVPVVEPAAAVESVPERASAKVDDHPPNPESIAAIAGSTERGAKHKAPLSGGVAVRRARPQLEPLEPAVPVPDGPRTNTALPPPISLPTDPPSLPTAPLAAASVETAASKAPVADDRPPLRARPSLARRAVAAEVNSGTAAPTMAGGGGASDSWRQAIWAGLFAAYAVAMAAFLLSTAFANSLVGIVTMLLVSVGLLMQASYLDASRSRGLLTAFAALPQLLLFPHLIDLLSPWSELDTALRLLVASLLALVATLTAAGSADFDRRAIGLSLGRPLLNSKGKPFVVRTLIGVIDILARGAFQIVVAAVTALAGITAVFYAGIDGGVPLEQLSLALLLTAVTVAALSQELLFRGVLQTAAVRRFGRLRGIVVVAAISALTLFATVPGTPLALLWLFGFTLLLGALSFVGRSLVGVVLAQVLLLVLANPSIGGNCVVAPYDVGCYLEAVADLDLTMWWQGTLP